MSQCVGLVEERRLGGDYLVYLLLFPLSFISIYVAPWITPLINVLILAVSYYYIIYKKDISAAIYLLIFSRCLNGFVLSQSPVVYGIVNFLTSYFPFVVYFFVSGRFLKLNDPFGFLIRKFPASVIYVFLMFCFMLPDLFLGLQMFFVRVAPMIFLLFSFVVYREVMDFNKLLVFFRFVYLSSIFCFFATDYVDVSYDLLESGVVFSKEVVGQSIEMFGAARLMGVFWDFRIQGLFGIAYLMLALASDKYKLKYFDIFLAAFIVFLSLSRGSIVLGVLVGFGAVLYFSKNILRSLVVFVPVLLMVCAVFFIVSGDASDDLLGSFNVFSSESNALSQREGFREFALNVFNNNPFGSGLGYLKAAGVNRNIVIGDQSFERASDAFIFIQLAEIGFVGFVAFVLSFLEIVNKKNVLSYFVVFGFFVVMVGTDIPDMGVFYFCLMFLFSKALDKASNARFRVAVES